MPYYTIGLASAELSFENSWKEYFDPKWRKSLKYLKYIFIDQGYKSNDAVDILNSNANNTRDGMKIPNTELLANVNIMLDDQIQSTSWTFFTYIDNLSFLGGLLNTSLFIPSVLTAAYTFRINEINVFFYHQVMSKLHIAKDLHMKKTFNSVDKHTKYSKYILNNYVTLPFKIAFYIMASKSGLK